MTLKIVEYILVGLLALLSLMIWQRSFTQNILGIVYRILRLLLTYAAGYFTFKWVFSQGHGPILSGLGAAVAGFVVMFILGFILKPKKDDDDDEKRSLPNKLFQTLGNTILILLLWIVAAVAVDLTATIIEQSKFKNQIYNQSWLLHHVMDWHETTEAESDRKANPLLKKLSQSRDWLYDKIGMDQLFGQVDALSQIQQLAPQQRATLFNQDDNLKQLLENPDMLKVIQNAEIQQLVAQAGKGDGSALMQLSKHPDINKLFSDPQLYKQIMSINPKAILQNQQSQNK